MMAAKKVPLVTAASAKPNDPGLLSSTQVGEKGTDPCKLPADLHPHVCYATTPRDSQSKYM